MKAFLITCALIATFAQSSMAYGNQGSGSIEVEKYEDFEVRPELSNKIEYKEEEEEEKKWGKGEEIEEEEYEEHEEPEYEQEYREEETRPKKYSKKPVLKCPVLKHCKNITGLNRALFKESDYGPSGTVCVYTKDNLNSCNLSRGGSFCYLQGKYFGPKEVKIDAEGFAYIRHC